MKQLVAIVCAMFAAFAFGAEKKAAPKKTSITESELRAIAKAKPNAKDAGTLYRVGMATNNVERKQEFFKASAACLLACGKIDTYRKYIKGKLANVEAFEDSLKDKCKRCDGEGKKGYLCHACSGNGKCSTCKGSGQTVSVEFDRPNGTKPCHKCRGSGECNKCGGAGSTQAKCGSCAGTGKVFRESVAERVFRDTCIAIAEDPSVAAAKGKAAAAGRERKRIAAEARAKAEAEERERKRIAETHGDAHELFKKGLAYYLGIEVPQNYSRAIEYFSDASKRGWLDADAVLSHMYFDGLGCEPNALNWVKSFNHAQKGVKSKSENMSDLAKYSLACLYYNGLNLGGPNDFIPEDHFKSYEYLSSCKSHGEALCFKGLMEYHGDGTMKNPAKAAGTFMYTIENCKDGTNKGKAAICLGYMFYKGEGVRKDYDTAWMLLCEGTNSAFPELIRAAKAPLTSYDIASFNRNFSSNEISLWTPFSWKMLNLYGGKFADFGGEVNLLKKALMILFNPDAWIHTGIKYNFEHL